MTQDTVAERPVDITKARNELVAEIDDLWTQYQTGVKEAASANTSTRWGKDSSSCERRLLKTKQVSASSPRSAGISGRPYRSHSAKDWTAY